MFHHSFKKAMEKRRLPIVTHSGRFRIEEVMAAAILSLLGRWNGSIIRTRDPAVIQEHIGNAFIIGVGGIYDPDNLQFDGSEGVKKSSCDLIYVHFGTGLFSSEEI